MMIDGCLAWERKDTTLEFSLLEQGRLMSGARAVHTQRSCLVWVYVGRSSSCHVVWTAAWCWKSFTLIFPPWVVLVVGVVFYFFSSSPCKLFLNVSLCCWSRVWSWHDFNVTNAVGAGTGSIPTVLHGARHSWLSINYKRHATPYNTKKRKSISDIIGWRFITRRQKAQKMETKIIIGGIIIAHLAQHRYVMRFRRASFFQA